MREKAKMQEQMAASEIENKLRKEFRNRLGGIIDDCNGECQKVYNSFKLFEKETDLVYKALDKMKGIFTRQENILIQIAISCKLGDIEQIYHSLGVVIPDAVLVAMFMLREFQRDEFNLNKPVKDEYKMQQEIENLIREE